MKPRGQDFKGAPARFPILRDNDACPHPTKQWYDSKRLAKAALMRAPMGRAKLRPYLCACGAWHLGHRA